MVLSRRTESCFLHLRIAIHSLLFTSDRGLLIGAAHRPSGAAAPQAVAGRRGTHAILLAPDDGNVMVRGGHSVPSTGYEPIFQDLPHGRIESSEAPKLTRSDCALSEEEKNTHASDATTHSQTRALDGEALRGRGSSRPGLRRPRKAVSATSASGGTARDRAPRGGGTGEYGIICTTICFRFLYESYICRPICLGQRSDALNLNPPM